MYAYNCTQRLPKDIAEKNYFFHVPYYFLRKNEIFLCCIHTVSEKRAMQPLGYLSINF